MFKLKLITVLGFILTILELTLGFTEDPYCDCGQQTLIKPYIINGKTDDPQRYPWLAGIYRKPNFYLCGGSVITRRHILTAGHCIHGRDPGDHGVVVGMQSQHLSSGRRHLIIDWTLHENYRTIEQMEKEGDFRNDIAIIQVFMPIKFDELVWPICVNDHEPNFYDSPAIVAGWGLTTCDENIPAKYLQVGLMKLSPPDECARRERKFYHKQTLLCLLDSDVVPYRGDSGSPLVVDTRSGYFLQVGIVSFSLNCVGPDSGVFFTNVSAYIDWIHEHTVDVDNCKVPL